MVRGVKAARKAGATCELLGVLPTFLDLRESETYDQHDWLIEKFKGLVWPAIPQNAAAARAPAYGQPWWEYAPRERVVRGMEKRGEWVGGYGRVLARLIREVGLDG